MFPEHSKAFETVRTLILICASPPLLEKVYRQFCGLHGLVIVVTCSVGPYSIYTGVFVNYSMSNQFNVPQVVSNQVLETSQGQMTNKMHLTTIGRANSLNTYVNERLQF